MSQVSLAPKAQQLNPFVTYDAIAQEASNKRWELVWKVAAIAATIFFIIATVAAVAVTAVYFPDQLFAISLVLFVSALPMSVKVINSIWAKSTAYGKAAAFDAKLIKHMSRIDFRALPTELKRLGVTPGTPLGITPGGPLKQLKALFARYCYYKAAQNKNNEEYNEICNKNDKSYNFTVNKKAFKVHKQDWTYDKVDWKKDEQRIIFNKVKELRVHLKDLKRKAATRNVKAAYVLKLMQSPYEKRSTEDFVHFAPFDAIKRLILKGLKDPGANILIKAGTGEKAKNYTVSELRKKDTTELARKIFELPAASAV